MKEIQLYTAVLLTALDLVDEQEIGASIHDITQEVRKRTNDGDYDLTDVDYDPNMQRYEIEHSNVKRIVNEAYENGLLGSCEKVFGGGYFIFKKSKPVQFKHAATGVNKNFNSFDLTATIKDKPLSVAVPKISLGGWKPATPRLLMTTKEKIACYVRSKGVATVKQIQSRLKGTQISCKEIHNLVTSDPNTFYVYQDTSTPSQAIVKRV